MKFVFPKFNMRVLYVKYFRWFYNFYTPTIEQFY